MGPGCSSRGGPLSGVLHEGVHCGIRSPGLPKTGHEGLPRHLNPVSTKGHKWKPDGLGPLWGSGGHLDDRRGPGESRVELRKSRGRSDACRGPVRSEAGRPPVARRGPRPQGWRCELFGDHSWKTYDRVEDRGPDHVCLCRAVQIPGLLGRPVPLRRCFPVLGEPLPCRHSFCRRHFGSCLGYSLDDGSWDPSVTPPRRGCLPVSQGLLLGGGVSRYHRDPSSWNRQGGHSRLLSLFSVPPRPVRERPTRGRGTVFAVGVVRLDLRDSPGRRKGPGDGCSRLGQ